MTAKVHQIDDITRNYHGGNSNSEAANEYVQPTKKGMQGQVLDYITSRGKMGATCQEAERDLGMKHQTCSARFSELKQSHHIHWNGIKRALPGSRPASVYVSSPGQLFLLAD